jgi:hypothetical protein
MLRALTLLKAGKQLQENVRTAQPGSLYLKEIKGTYQ